MKAMTADTKPLTLNDLRRELRRERSELRRDFDRTLQHYATRADLHAIETRLTIRLSMLLAGLGGVLVAVDRLWT
ncbi:MAG: hypothetical protein OXG64_07620 [Chloroflexi bacterium]|nr:hypothetical protein [Chloroflexota bacterium]